MKKGKIKKGAATSLLKRKKEKKIKTFVLTVSKTFLMIHPKAGQKTFFRKKILNGEKRHTIRSNFKYWFRIVKLINNGKAILSIRQWSGKPYNSKQIEILKLKKVGYNRVKIVKDKFIKIDDREEVDYNEFIDQLAQNDGLKTDDFKNWFPKHFEGIIIHFKNATY